MLLLTAAMRLYHLSAPVVNGFWDKQVAVANKARNMAGPPWNLLHASFDFTSERGERIAISEEIPVYHSLVALGYRAFGEQDWFGRAVSALASLAAIAAFYAVVGREFGPRRALVASILLASCPLLVFYGRAVVPDVAMLAGMLAAVCCYQKYQARGRIAWLVASGVAVLAAAGFKYYGLMVLLPLAELASRRHSFRGPQSITTSGCRPSSRSCPWDAGCSPYFCRRPILLATIRTFFSSSRRFSGRRGCGAAFSRAFSGRAAARFFAACSQWEFVRRRRAKRAAKYPELDRNRSSLSAAVGTQSDGA